MIQTVDRKWVDCPPHHSHSGYVDTMAKRKIHAPVANQTLLIQPIFSHFSERAISMFSELGKK
jgi:hypothetical protein